MASQNTTTRGDDRLSNKTNWFGPLGGLFATGRSEDAAGQKKKKPRALSSLPAEIRLMIYGYIEPSFFRENVSRLTVSREWYHYALPTMYREIDWSRMVDPQAAGRILGLALNTLSEQLDGTRKWTLDLDKMFQSRQFTPVDYDLPGQPDMAQRRRENSLNPRLVARVARIPSPWELAVDLRQVHPPNVDEAAKRAGALLGLLFRSTPAAEEIEVVIRKPWGIHRWAVMWFERDLVRLDTDMVTRLLPCLRTVRLDLAGLARRLSRWPAHPGGYELGAHMPIFWTDDNAQGRGFSLLDDFSRQQEDHPRQPQSARHACRFVRRMIMSSEAVEVRTRSFCPDMLRVWVGTERTEWYQTNFPTFMNPEMVPWDPPPNPGEDDPEPPLPRLKELTVNMVMPFGRFRHDQVMHCDARDCLLNRPAQRHYAALATDVATVEIERFVRRLENPRKVILRWAEASLVDGSGPPVHWELDALTGQRRMIKVDLNGEFARYLTDEEEWAARRNEVMEELAMNL